MEELTLSEAFRNGGYRTGSIGKWHLGSEPFSLPEHHRFDFNTGGNAHDAPENDFDPWHGYWAIAGTGQQVRWNVPPDGQQGDDLTNRLTDEAMKFIKQCGDQLFFQSWSNCGVHTPLQAPETMIRNYRQIPAQKRRGDTVYAAKVESIDDSVGRVMETLQQ